MSQPRVVHDTFVIERSFPLAPAKVFTALSDTAKKRRWFAEGESHDIEEFASDFRVGGTERFLYRFKEGTPFPGVSLASEGRFEDIVADQRIVTASTMSLGDQRISASLVTMELVQAENGTDLICTHQGTFFENSDGPQRRLTGWQTLLNSLERELSHS